VFELASVAASEGTENGGVKRKRESYSVMVTGEGWDVEKEENSEDAILPIQGGLVDNGIRVTTLVAVL
jgi:hypothetical protein